MVAESNMQNGTKQRSRAIFHVQHEGTRRAIICGALFLLRFFVRTKNEERIARKLITPGDNWPDILELLHQD